MNEALKYTEVLVNTWRYPYDDPMYPMCDVVFRIHQHVVEQGDPDRFCDAVMAAHEVFMEKMRRRQNEHQKDFASKTD